MAEAQGGLECA